MCGARNFSELVVWQLADELRQQSVKLTGRPTYLRNVSLREQTDDAIDSICRNVAEGFSADTHGQFAWFLRISRRSLNEVQDALLSAQHKQILSPADLAEARILIKRLRPALDRLIDYLERSPKQRNRPPLRIRPEDIRRIDSQPPKKKPKDPGTGKGSQEV